MDLSRVTAGIQRMFIRKANNERRIKYLRNQGSKIGQQCEINTVRFSTEPYLIEIGDHVAISSGSELITHDGAAAWCFDKELDGGVFGRIKIGNNVFIGQQSVILPNTTIGNNCIIGAGSVVRGEIPDNSIAVGNPAKIILRTNAQLMFYRNNSGYCKTKNLNSSQTIKLLKENFGIE